MTRHRPNRRTDDSCARGRSAVHSARVEHEVEVHYRWHALFGRRVRERSSEVRAGVRVSYVEASPGVVISVPSWMLDRAACADLTLGDPHVDVAALVDLTRLLTDRGFRRSSSGEVRVAREEPDAASAQASHSNGSKAAGAAPACARVRSAAAVEDADAGSPKGRRTLGQPPDAGGGRRPGGGGRRGTALISSLRRS